MKYTFACKRVPLNDSIKEYAQKKISKLERYFREEDTTAFVTFSVEKDHLCSVEITIRGGATLLRAHCNRVKNKPSALPLLLKTWDYGTRIISLR